MPGNLPTSDPDAAVAEATSGPRRRGRPPKPIERAALVSAVERLFSQGGLKAVSIEQTAKELSVSRATLYRTVASKEDLLGIPFEGMTHNLDSAARKVSKTEYPTPTGKLEALVRVQVHSCVQMREYLFVFWDGGSLPRDVYDRWRKWRHEYEEIWRAVVTECIEAGELNADDPKVATRLILGMTIWVSRWYRPDEGLTEEQISDHVMRLIHPGD